MIKRTKRKFQNERRTLSAVRALASRAVFQEAAGAIPKVAMQYEMTNGEVITFELEYAEAVYTVESMVAAIHAITPPMRTSRGGIGL